MTYSGQDFVHMCDAYPTHLISSHLMSHGLVTNNIRWKVQIVLFIIQSLLASGLVNNDSGQRLVRLFRAWD